MQFSPRTRRVAAVTSLCVAVTGAGAATLVAIHPSIAAAAGALVQVVTCTTTGASPCIDGVNTTSGIGVRGISNSGTALRGQSTSQFGLKATSSSGDAIFAQTTTGQGAVVATSVSTNGVYGYTTGGGGTGVYGLSQSNYGLYGTTATGNGIAVVGNESAGGVGTYGYSAKGIGAEALSAGSVGLYARNYGAGEALQAIAGTGRAIDARNSSGNGNATVYGYNSNGNAGEFSGSYIALIGRAPTGGYPLVLTDTSGANNILYVDGSGNLSYKGGLFHFSSVRGGATVRSFTPNTTQPTIEDFGTAQLVGGAAAVRLDPTFAASIGTTGAYRVFMTPNGDTRGLFVATKTPNGFVVRESQGGRSTVTFDYRIVAAAAGQENLRMAVVNPALRSQAGPAAAAAPLAAPIAPQLVKPAVAPQPPANTP